MEDLPTDLAAVLPPGIERQLGDPPPEPIDYDDGYCLPSHCEKPLARLHSHPLDARLRFYEAPHVYTFDGVPTTISVTALAHEFEKSFVARDAIASMKMARAQAWPRLEYVHNARPFDASAWTPETGVLRVHHGRTVAVVHPHSLEGTTTPEKSVHVMLRAARVPPAPG